MSDTLWTGDSRRPRGAHGANGANGANGAASVLLIRRRRPPRYVKEPFERRKPSDEELEALLAAKR